MNKQRSTLRMRICEDHEYPQPPVKPGNYLIGLSSVRNWYNKVVLKKGKSPNENNLDLILPILVDRVFGVENEHSDKIDFYLNLDCIIKDEAVFVKEQLEKLLVGQVTSVFPKIGAVLKPDYYTLFEKDLLIDVPSMYEDQRGYFF